ncbi:MAG TPA: hypothetical protein PKB02_04515 [Anaerohalosphaeraceae bacterium]|nr:hypothetical protein [Anaerohalosphaeraceae bacterium]
MSHKSVDGNKCQQNIPNGYDYSAAATGRLYAACVHGVKSPCIAVVIMLLLAAGG